MYIYQINVGNVSYYGKAQNPKARKAVHKTYLNQNKHHNIWLQRSFNKHKNFEFKILAENLSENEANEMEIRLIAENDCCNLTKGGDGMLGRKMSKRNIEAFSVAREAARNRLILEKYEHWLAVKR